MSDDHTDPDARAVAGSTADDGAQLSAAGSDGGATDPDPQDGAKLAAALLGSLKSVPEPEEGVRETKGHAAAAYAAAARRPPKAAESAALAAVSINTTEPLPIQPPASLA